MSEPRLNMLGAGKLFDHGSGRWRSAIDVPPLAPILCQHVPLSERDESKHQVTSNDVAPSLLRVMTRTGTRELTEDDLFRNPGSVHTGNVTKPTHSVLTKKIRDHQRHAKPLHNCEHDSRSLHSAVLEIPRIAQTNE